TELRAEKQGLRMGFAGSSTILDKYFRENEKVNGTERSAVYAEDEEVYERFREKNVFLTKDYEELLDQCEAVYIVSPPAKHYAMIRRAIEKKKHVLCESPITVCREQTAELTELAARNGVVLMEAIKTAYATAYDRLLLLVKSGKIGRVVSVDATCTSIRSYRSEPTENWNSICAWGPTAMLPIFQILGTGFDEKRIRTLLTDAHHNDAFTRIDFTYPGAVASMKVGQGVKSEGDLVISGTEGYIYVPAPWWKTDYFEVRYENAENNQRYFYQLEGEGISFTILSFLRAIESGQSRSYIAEEITAAISGVIEDFYAEKDTIVLK
ncbi:MAG: Gfo/Idh/MocA family oxidoreductase, partial [Eubacteriales bacterium]|nr:Gfo/Idh/MocA family oxidoreductase [Eubacteriales bacterium]